LQATVNKRLSHSFQFLAAYTLSRSVDSAQDSLGSAAFGVYGATVFGEQVFNDQNNVAAQQGPSDFDRRHRFVLSENLAAAAAANHQHGLLSTLAAGWTVSGVVTLHLAFLSVFSTVAPARSSGRQRTSPQEFGAGASLDDARRSGSVSSRVNQFFSTSVFVPAPFIPDGGLIDGKYPVTAGGTIFGNLGRNILRGPGQRNVDMALVKRTRVGEKASIVFRWEVFNVFNWPNFANPAGDVSSPSTFGKNHRDERESSDHAIRIEGRVLMPLDLLWEDGERLYRRMWRDRGDGRREFLWRSSARNIRHSPRSVVSRMNMI